MNTIKHVKALVAAMVTLPSMLLIQSVYASPVNCERLQPLTEKYDISAGNHHDVRINSRIERIAIGDPEVADVQLSSKQAFVITGKKAGRTSLLVWSECSDVPMRSSISVESAVVAGLKNKPTRAQTSASAKPASEIPSQVQTDIRFVEVSRSKLMAASTSLYGGRQSGNFLFGSPGTARGAVATPGNVFPQALSGVPLVGDAFNIVWGGGSSRILGALSLLETNGFAYTLAQPSLVALSGQSANFLAGGEFPIPVPQSSDVVTIEYKQFGVLLTLTPTVVNEDQIILKVAPEVSELDYNSGVQIMGTTVPALRVRRSDTSISLADGESFIISGLISKNTLNSVDKLPGLGDIPILGAFFQSKRIESEDRELLMIVTPRLVRPMAKNADLSELPGDAIRDRDQNFLEFYFMENGKYDSVRSDKNGYSN